MRFSLYLEVDDPQKLYEAALERALAEDAEYSSFYPIYPEEQYSDRLGTANAPDVHGCLQQLLDPGDLAGCSISSSALEN